MNPRSKNYRVVTGLVVILSLLVLVFKAIAPSEPTYQGKSLTAWVQQYDRNHWGRGKREAAQQAETAIRQIGTQAIPFLVNRMHARDSALKKNLRNILPRGWWAPLRLDNTSVDERRVGAAGLMAMGTNAAPSLSELIQIARHHPEEDGRYVAFFTIRNLRSAAAPAVPFLIQNLTNSVHSIREEAALTLGLVGLYADQVVPALLGYLESQKASPHWHQCESAIYSLSRFGTNSRVALPTIVAFLEHPQSGVRESVTNCLPLIDPELAAKVLNIKQKTHSL